MTKKMQDLRDAAALTHAKVGLSGGSSMAKPLYYADSLKDLELAPHRVNGFKAGFDARDKLGDEALNSIQPLIVKHLMNNECDCGAEEACGEGYAGGICFLHEALATIKKLMEE